jgi:CheY-like chemotaxis protein
MIISLPSDGPHKFLLRVQRAIGKGKHMIDLKLPYVLRSHPRTTIPTTAYAIKDGRILPYKGDNLSAGGALLSDGPPLEVESEYRLILCLPDSVPIALRCRVVRLHLDAHKQTAYGVAFRRGDAKSEDYLHHLVLSHLKNQKVPMPSVLVVDDCANARRAIKRELRSLGMTAVLAPMPLDAVRLLRDETLHIQVAIVDLHLGPADGFQLLKYLDKEYQHIRRILISGESRSGQLELAVSTGHAHAVLPKPWDREHIAKALAA